MDFDWRDHDRGAAALFAAAMLLTPTDVWRREQRMAAALRFIDDLLERGWGYVDEPAGGDPKRGLFFAYELAAKVEDDSDPELVQGYHSLFVQGHPVEGTIVVVRSIDEPDYIDLAPKAWFTFEDTDALATVLDAIPALGYKDELPLTCYELGAIVEWGDPFYESTLTVNQVLERRRGPSPAPAHQVLDALQEVYDTCPKCGTYTGGQPHSCR